MNNILLNFYKDQFCEEQKFTDLLYFGQLNHDLKDDYKSITYSTSHVSWINNDNFIFYQLVRQNVTQVKKSELSNRNIIKLRAIYGFNLGLSYFGDLYVEKVIEKRISSPFLNFNKTRKIIDFETDGISMVIVYEGGETEIIGREFAKWTLISSNCSRVVFSENGIHLFCSEGSNNSAIKTNGDVIYEENANDVTILKYVGNNRSYVLPSKIGHQSVSKIASSVFDHADLLEQLEIDLKYVKSELVLLSLLGLPKLKVLKFVNHHQPVELSITDCMSLRRILWDRATKSRIIRLHNAVQLDEKIQRDPPRRLECVLNQNVIHSWFYERNSAIRSIIFSDQVKIIDDYALNNLEVLEYVQLPASLLKFLNALFCACPRLKKIDIVYPDHSLTIDLEFEFDKMQAFFLKGKFNHFTFSDEKCELDWEHIAENFKMSKEKVTSKSKIFETIYRRKPEFPYNKRFYDKYMEDKITYCFENDDSKLFEKFLNDFDLHFRNSNINELLDRARKSQALGCTIKILEYTNRSKNFGDNPYNL